MPKKPKHFSRDYLLFIEDLAPKAIIPRLEIAAREGLHISSVGLKILQERIYTDREVLAAINLVTIKLQAEGIRVNT